MAETIVQNQICTACGVDVRPNSMFCYNCGGAVFENAENETENVNKYQTSLLDEKLIPKQTEKVEPEIELESDKNPKSKTNLQEEAKLKTAAAMRRKAKTTQNKTTEIIWEEPESNSSLPLILTALIFTIIAALLVYFAMTLK